METKHFLLIDGRTIAYIDAGDPNGTPVIYAHGGPGSRLEAAWLRDAAQRKGFRFITTDRPGFGESTYLENRLLLDYPRDIAELADCLGIEKFGVMGWSGGGIHTTICAQAIPERLLFNFSFAGYTNWGQMPDAPSYLRSSNKLDKMATQLSREYPKLFRFFFEMMSLSDKLMPEKTVDAIVAELNDTDKAIAASPEFRRILVADQHEAFKQGSKGPTRDAYLHLRDWGIKLEDIAFPINVFHGTDDYLVPIEYAYHLKEHVPDCRLHIWEGEGHLAPNDHLDEIFDLARREIQS